MSSKRVRHYFSNPLTGGLDLISGSYDAERRAARTAKKQEEEIARQKGLEQLSLAEAEDEKKRRMALAKYGGRRSLIASSVNGTSKGSTDQLGG